MVTYTLARALNWGYTPVEQRLGLSWIRKRKESRGAKYGGTYL